jgi:hypothetical protein
MKVSAGVKKRAARLFAARKAMASGNPHAQHQFTDSRVIGRCVALSISTGKPLAKRHFGNPF